MERNYKEDQTNEVEALDSIYCGEMEILAADPYHKFQIPIHTEEYNPDDEDNGLSCQLIFTYTEKYPDTAPIVEIDEVVNFENGYESRLLEHIQETINENLGLEMVFSLVSSAQEWLNVRWDEHKKEVENIALEKKRVLEEAEQKKFEGTRVTVETFMTWKKEFELDMGIAQKREKIAAEAKKLTGKEQFLTDVTLVESDLKFLLAAGDNVDNVKIDESLFQNIEDFDLGSDDDDDNDYVPGQSDSDD